MPNANQATKDINQSTNNKRETDDDDELKYSNGCCQLASRLFPRTYDFLLRIPDTLYAILYYSRALAIHY